MEYEFSDEAQKHLLEKLKYTNVSLLGTGACSCVWKATKDDSTTVAVKIQFDGEEDFKAEQLLNSLKPEELKKPSFIAIFNKDTKAKSALKNYYKYLIIFNTKKEIESAFEEIFNKEMELKRYNLMASQIFVYAGEKRGKPIKNFSELSQYFNQDMEAYDSIKTHFETHHRVHRRVFPFLLLKNAANRLYIAEALLADQSLQDYLDKIIEKRSVLLTLSELQKLAKHILKALAALHKDGIVHHDLHTGNVTRTVVKPDGKPAKVKFHLIDFNFSEVSLDEDKIDESWMYTKKNDLEKFARCVLQPAFYEIFRAIEKGSELSLDHDENFSSLSDIDGMDPMFIQFLQKLSKPSGYKTAEEALNDPFLKKKYV